MLNVRSFDRRPLKILNQSKKITNVISKILSWKFVYYFNLNCCKTHCKYSHDFYSIFMNCKKKKITKIDFVKNKCVTVHLSFFRSDSVGFFSWKLKINFYYFYVYSSFERVKNKHILHNIGYIILPSRIVNNSKNNKTRQKN